MDFQYRLANRTTYPQKHILICEDLIANQSAIMKHLSNIFASDGVVQISLVPGAAAASAIIAYLKIDLILLDHSMPQGSGPDLIQWMKKHNYNVPIIAFSSTQEHNTHMGNLGATYYWWTKQDIINGAADDLIKGLTLHQSSIAELYSNTLCRNFFSHRWWADPKILVGGSILNQSDWLHLQNTYNIQSVINVESEHSDFGKGIKNLCEQLVPDNGAPFSKEAVLNVVNFAKNALQHGNIYVHCQMGSSRSPAFAYAILRYCFNMSKEDALGRIASKRPDAKKYGYHPYHQSYLNSVEAALNADKQENIGIAEYYTNTITANNMILPRYWVTPTILVGGNIIDIEDWAHLQKDFGINAAISLDGKLDIDSVLRLYVPDNGDFFPEEYIHQIIDIHTLPPWIF
jgi:CheY-like chemotaxis protein